MAKSNDSAVPPDVARRVENAIAALDNIARELRTLTLALAPILEKGVEDDEVLSMLSLLVGVASTIERETSLHKSMFEAFLEAGRGSTQEEAAK